MNSNSNNASMKNVLIGILAAIGLITLGCLLVYVLNQDSDPSEYINPNIPNPTFTPDQFIKADLDYCIDEADFEMYFSYDSLCNSLERCTKKFDLMQPYKPQSGKQLYDSNIHKKVYKADACSCEMPVDRAKDIESTALQKKDLCIKRYK